MSTQLDPSLPHPLLTALLQDDNEGFTILLASLDKAGWPHHTLLSVGEVLPLDDRCLRIALWPASTAVQNLIDNPKATLGAVVNEISYTAKLQFSLRGILNAPRSELAVFDAEVSALTADAAPYARISSGISFELDDPVATFRRWATTRRWLGQLDFSE